MYKVYKHHITVNSQTPLARHVIVRRKTKYKNLKTWWITGSSVGNINLATKMCKTFILFIPCIVIRTHKHTSFSGIYPWKRRWFSAIDFCLQSNNSYYDTHCTMLFNLFNYFSICILTLPLHSYNINDHYCILLCWILPWGWPKEAETCRRITTCLDIIVYNHSAVVGIYMVTCLAELNMNNSKFSDQHFHFNREVYNHYLLPITLARCDLLIYQ
jgi:hypothetical protein